MNERRPKVSQGTNFMYFIMGNIECINLLRMTLQRLSIIFFLISLLITAVDAIGQNEASDWVYYNTSNSDIPFNGINTLVIDNDGNIWTSFAQQGVAKFDGETWTAYNSSNSDFPEGSVQGVCPYDGMVWFLVWGINGSSDILVRYQDGAWHSWPQFYRFAGMNVDRNGTVWLSTGDGVVSFDGTDFTHYNTESTCLYQNLTTASYYDTEDGTLWVGMYGSQIEDAEAGLVKLNGDGCAVFQEDNSGFPTDNWVYSIFRHPFEPEQLWVNTNRGTGIYNGETWDYLAFEGSRSTGEIAIDSNAIVWIGTTFHGLVRISEDTTRVFFGLPDYEVSGIAVDAENGLWVATGTKGLAMLENISTPTDHPVSHAQAIRCYPSPTSGNLTVEWTGVDSNSALFTLFDINGRVLVDADIHNGMNYLTLPIHIPRGIHFYTVRTSEGVLLSTNKIVVNEP